jgi:hypothetical protein
MVGQAIFPGTQVYGGKTRLEYQKEVLILNRQGFKVFSKSANVFATE